MNFDQAKVLGKPGLIDIRIKENCFNFIVEGTGSLRAGLIIKQSLEILKKKLESLKVKLMLLLFLYFISFLWREILIWLSNNNLKSNML